MGTKSKFKGLVACTKAQFDGLTTKNNDKIYLVTDDASQGTGSALYMHVVTFSQSESGRVFYGKTVIISRSATVITSLDGIKAILGENFYYPCCAYYEDTDVIFMSMGKNVFYSTKETTTKSWTGVNISDVVIAV